MGSGGWWGLCEAGQGRARGCSGRRGFLSGEKLAATCQGADLEGLGQAMMVPFRTCLGHWVTCPPNLATDVPTWP